MIHIGIVESRFDPLKLGRCKCRVVGLHTHDKSILPTDDLPWAYPLQSITSAGISGIGNSPTGLVEGSTVLIVFTDEDKQQPIMIGSIGGIPQSSGELSVDNESLDVVDEDGQIDDETVSAQSSMAIPSSYKLSAAGIDLIKQFETKKLTSFQDTNGTWIIGYGVSSVNGSPVYPGQTITDAVAESSFYDYVSSTAVPDVVSRVKVPITQSMFDALVSLAYNMGGPKFGRTTIVSELNRGEYLSAAAQITQYNADSNGNVLSGLVNRRNKEKARFLNDAIDTSGINDIMTDGGSDNVGFKDPFGVYPTYFNEPDTNRLARGERIETTIVRKKELSREKNVYCAGITWTQSPVPYNSQYPYNHVYQSESGHLLEFDDTKNSERIHLYHKAGTFFEIDENGTEVKKIVGDGYEILERDGYLYIKGDRAVTIDGNSSVQINNAHNVNILGQMTVNVFNNVNMNVSGDMNVSVKGTYNLKAGAIKMETPSADFKIDTIRQQYNNLSILTNTKTETMNGDCHLRYNGDLHTMIGADTYSRHESGIDWSCPSDPPRTGDVSCADVNSGSNANQTNLGTPAAVAATVTKEKAKLTVLTRGSELVASYDTPDDGDPTAFREKLKSKGVIDPDEVDTTTEQQSAAPAKNSVAPKGASCDAIFGRDTFPLNFQLSNHFNISALTLNGKYQIRPQVNLTPQEIVCNLKGLAENCLDIIRDTYPNMIITSGFRYPGSPSGSSKNSQHNKGQAADMQFTGFSRKQYFEVVQAIQQLVPYDQLLLEYEGSTKIWIHISFKYEGNRKQHFTMKNNKRISDIGVFKYLE